MLKQAKEYWYVFAIGFILILKLFFWVSPLHELSVSAVYLWPFAWAVLAGLLASRFHQLPKISFLLLPLVAWFFCTNALNGDPYLIVNQTFMIGVVISLGLAFPTISTVSERHQESAFKGLLIVFSLGVLLIVGLSLYSVLTNTLIYSPFADHPLGLSNDARLWTFTTHPNESSCAFVTAFCGLMYLALSAKKTVWKILCAIGGIAIYFALATTVSRTGMILFSLVVAALLYVLAFSYLTKKHGFQTLRAFLCTAPIALVCAFVVFLSFTPAIEGMASLNQQAEIKQQTAQVDASASLFGISVASAETSEPTSDPSTDDPELNLVSRDITADLSTFTARDELWFGGLSYLKDRPITLLIGQLDSVVARLPQQLLGRSEFHFHSVLIETLVLTGIPGFALYVGFLIFVFIASFRLLFGKGVSMAKRFLAVVPLILFLNMLVEIYPSYQSGSANMMYFLLCGAVVAFSTSHQKNALQAK